MPCERALSNLVGDFKGLDVSIFAAAEWGENPSALEEAKAAIAANKGDSYWEVMKRMPLNLVMGCMLFFWTLEKDLLSVMKNSLKTQENPILQEKLTSMLSTDGITLSGDLQTKTSQK